MPNVGFAKNGADGEAQDSNKISDLLKELKSANLTN
jgi:hypothetical protein